MSMSSDERRSAIARAVQVTEDGNGRLDIRLRIYPNGGVWIHSEQCPDCNYSRTSHAAIVADLELILHEAWTIIADRANDRPSDLSPGRPS